MKILSLLVVSFALVACFPKTPEMPAPSSSLDQMLEEKMAEQKAAQEAAANGEAEVEAEVEVEAPVEAPVDVVAEPVVETEEQRVEREEAEAAQIKAEEDPSIIIEEELTDQPIIIE